MENLGHKKKPISKKKKKSNKERKKLQPLGGAEARAFL